MIQYQDYDKYFNKIKISQEEKIEILRYFEALALIGIEYHKNNEVKNELEKGLNESGTDFGSISESVNTLVSQLPEGALNLASKFGFNVNDAISDVVSAAPDSNESLIEMLMTNIGDNIFLTITEAVTMIALFIVVSIALTFVIRLLNGVVKKIPVVKQTNKLAGGFLGLVKAVVIIFVVSTVLFFIAGSSSNQDLVEIDNIASYLKEE